MEIILLPPKRYTGPHKQNSSLRTCCRLLARDSFSNGNLLKSMTNTLIFTSFLHNMANERMYLFSPLLFPYFSPKTWRDGLVFAVIINLLYWTCDPVWMKKKILKNHSFYFLYIVLLSATRIFYFHSLTSPDKHILCCFCARELHMKHSKIWYHKLWYHFIKQNFII